MQGQISSDIPQFWLGNIRPRDAFRPIARERKYLMDYNIQLSPEGKVNGGGYIPRREASRYIATALHRS